MKKNYFSRLAIIALVASLSISANAQGLLGKVKKAAQTATSIVGGDSSESETNIKICCDSIPVYVTKAYVVTNEDGTTEKRYFLEDQFGQKRTAEAVKAQHKRINKSIGNILLKVGGGAAMGLLSSGGKGAGAVAGAASGAIASADDIACLTKIKKSMKAANKMIEAYSKSFTEEGKPIDANVDITKIANAISLDDVEGTLSKAEYAAIISSEEFKSEELNCIPDFE